MGKPCICCGEQPDVCSSKRNRFDSDKYEPQFVRHAKTTPHAKTERRVISKIFKLEDGVRTDDPPVTNDSGWNETESKPGDPTFTYDDEKFVIKAFEKREERDTEYGPENFELITREDEEEERTTQERYFVVNFVESWLVLVFNINDMGNWKALDFQGKFKYTAQKLAIFMSDNLDGFEDDETPKIRIHGVFFDEDIPANVKRVQQYIERSDKKKEIEYQLSTSSVFEEEDAVWIDVGRYEDDEKNWDTLQGNGQYIFIAEPVVGSCELGSHPKNQTFYETKTHSRKEYNNIPYVFLEFVRRRGELQRKNFATGELYYDTKTNDEIKKKLLHVGENWHYDFYRTSDSERETYTSKAGYLLSDNYEFFFSGFFRQGFFNNFDSRFNYEIYRPRLGSRRRDRRLSYLEIDQYYGDSYSTFPDEIAAIAPDAVWDEFNYDKRTQNNIVRQFGTDFANLGRVFGNGDSESLDKQMYKRNLPNKLYVYPRRISIKHDTPTQEEKEFIYRELPSRFYLGGFLSFQDSSYLNLSVNNLGGESWPGGDNRAVKNALDYNVVYDKRIFNGNSLTLSNDQKIALYRAGKDINVNEESEYYRDHTIAGDSIGWASLREKERIPYFEYRGIRSFRDSVSGFSVKNKKIAVHSMRTGFPEDGFAFHEPVRDNHEEIAGYYTRKSAHNYKTYIVDPEDSMAGAIFEFSLNQQFYPSNTYMRDIRAGEENKNCAVQCLDFKDHLPPIKMEIDAPFTVHNSLQIYSHCGSKLITIPAPCKISPTTRTATMSEYFCYYYDTMHYATSTRGLQYSQPTSADGVVVSSYQCDLEGDPQTSSIVYSADWNSIDQFGILEGTCPPVSNLPTWTLSKEKSQEGGFNCFPFSCYPAPVDNKPGVFVSTDDFLPAEFLQIRNDLLNTYAYADAYPYLNSELDDFFAYKFFTEEYDINTNVHSIPLTPGTETEFQLFFDQSPGFETDEVYAVTWSDFKDLRWENIPIKAGSSPYTTKQNLDKLKVYYNDEQLFGEQSIISYSVVWDEEWWKYADTKYWQRGMSDSDIGKNIDEFVTDTITFDGQLFNLVREKKYTEAEIERIQPNLWDDAFIIYKVTDEEPILDDQDNPVEQNGFWKITADSHEGPLEDGRGNILQVYDVHVYSIPQIARLTMDVVYFGAVSSYEEHNPRHSLWHRKSENQIQPYVAVLEEDILHDKLLRSSLKKDHYDDNFFVYAYQGREYNAVEGMTDPPVNILGSAMAYNYLDGSYIRDLGVVRDGLEDLHDTGFLGRMAYFNDSIDFTRGVFYDNRISASKSSKEVKPEVPQVVIDEFAYSIKHPDGYLVINGDQVRDRAAGDTHVSSTPLNIQRQQQSSQKSIGACGADDPEGPGGVGIMTACNFCEKTTYDYTIDVIQGDVSSKYNLFGYSPSHDLYQPQDIQQETNKAFEKAYTQTYPLLETVLDQMFSCQSRLTWLFEIDLNKVFDGTLDLDVHGGCSVQNFLPGRTGDVADNTLSEMDRTSTVEYALSEKELVLGGIDIIEEAFPRVRDIRNRRTASDDPRYENPNRFFSREVYFSRNWLPITAVHESRYRDTTNYPDLNLDTSISIWDQNTYLPAHKSFDPRKLSFLNFIDITRKDNKISIARKDDLFKWWRRGGLNSYQLPKHIITTPDIDPLTGLEDSATLVTSWPYSWQYDAPCGVRNSPISKFDIRPISLEFGDYWLKSNYPNICDFSFAGRSGFNPNTPPYALMEFETGPFCWSIDGIYNPEVFNTTLAFPSTYTVHLGYYSANSLNPYHRNLGGLDLFQYSYRACYVRSRFYDVIMRNLETILDADGDINTGIGSPIREASSLGDRRFLQVQFSFDNAVVNVDNISINLSVLQE